MATVAQRNIARTQSNQHDTYKIAHTARCKLHIAANRPDRNLRFVLGHAFTLDNLLLRIVEIENSSAKDEFDNAKPDHRESEIQAEDNRKAGIGGGAGVQVGETGSLARKDGAEGKRRKVSFGNSANFRPSDLKSGNGNGSPKRNKSPPPTAKEAEGSDNEEEDQVLKPQTAVMPGPDAGDKQEQDDEPVYDYDDGEDEDDGLGLTRFASASAQAPRKPSPPPAEEIPALSGSDSDEDEPDPPSPPSLPEDVTRKMIQEGEDDEAMKALYNQIRSCTCSPKHKDTPISMGFKSGIYEGKRMGVVTVEA